MLSPTTFKTNSAPGIAPKLTMATIVPIAKILQNIQCGNIKDIDIHDLGLKESVFYKVRELFHIL